MISVSVRGSYRNIERFLETNKDTNRLIRAALDRAGRQGVQALRAATPVHSGLAAQSWDYIVVMDGGYTVKWFNTDVESGFPVAIMLQYGYATGTGGYVAGRDYINPALRPIFQQIADDVWKAVTSA